MVKVTEENGWKWAIVCVSLIYAGAIVFAYLWACWLNTMSANISANAGAINKDLKSIRRSLDAMAEDTRDTVRQLKEDRSL